jgi:hypothetical protein
MFFLLHLLSFLEQAFRQLTQLARSSLLLGTAADLPLTRSHLIVENALLCQQLTILRLQVQKPHLTRSGRLCFLLWASCIPHWNEALLIFPPETLLCWHRQGFQTKLTRETKVARLFWKQAGPCSEYQNSGRTKPRGVLTPRGFVSGWPTVSRDAQP